MLLKESEWNNKPFSETDIMLEIISGLGFV